MLEEIAPESSVSKKQLRALLIVQPSASHYRAPLLRELLKDPSFDLVLLGRHGGKEIRRLESNVASASADVLALVKPIRDVKLFRNFRWQKGVLSRALRENADVYIFEGNPYILSTWAAIAVARMKRRRVALWGHGWKRPDSSPKLLLRTFFYRLASGHLLYGDWAKHYAGVVGMETSVFHPVYNSIYSEVEVKRITRAMQSTAIRRTAAGPVTLIFSGRLTRRHDVALAIDSVIRLRREGLPVELTVVGEGPEMNRLQELSHQHRESIRFVGAVYDVDRLAELYQRSTFAISPGASGLNVVQSLCFGVPVIAAKGHRDSGPEIESIVDNKTGVLFQADSVLELMSAIRRAGAMPETEYNRMISSAEAVVLERYTAEKHADAILGAVRRIASA